MRRRTAKAVEASRADGQVSYTLNVRVDAKTPAGYLNDHLVLVTNDTSASQIPVLVEGQVMPGITVNPTALFMGVVQPGQKVTKQLVVKSKKPFKILGVSCDDKSFQFDTSKAGTPKELHLVPVTFTAGVESQGGQDDQDHDRSGPDDARAGGLRGDRRSKPSRGRRKGTGPFFSAHRLFAKHVRTPKNGPVPGHEGGCATPSAL